MSHHKNIIAVVGATGNVGRKILEIILQRNLGSSKNLKLFASPQSAGSELKIGTHTFFIHKISEGCFNDCHIAIFATDSGISKAFVPMALKANLRVIDTSSAYRLDESVSLIVPPTNLEKLSSDDMLIATANCIAAPTAVVLKPLYDYVPIQRLVMTTFQSTSGAGIKAMDELETQIADLGNNKFCQNKIFDRQIAFNVIPHIDDFLVDGSTHEEYKITHEINKIISSNIKISVTSCRVPVRVGHCMSLAIEFSDEINLQHIKNILSKSHGVRLSQNSYTTPIEVEGADEVFVGRIRLDPSFKNGLLLWLTSDNLRRGAALDAVEILERVVKFSVLK